MVTEPIWSADGKLRGSALAAGLVPSAVAAGSAVPRAGPPALHSSDLYQYFIGSILAGLRKWKAPALGEGLIDH